MRRLIGIVILLSVMWPLYPQALENPHAVMLDVSGVIGSATGDYVTRGLRRAAAMGAALAIIRIDTPGGLDTAMREIIQAIINSPVPVVTYVAPSEARAAGAGTYILYASHISAMAPGTHLGAATPVKIVSPPSSSDGDTGESARDAKGDDERDTMSQKIINYAVTYIRSLAKMRNRNREWAEKTVRDAASLPADDALRIGVIDVMASDIPDLLKQIQGRKVMVLGQERVLNTAKMVIDEKRSDWRSKLLGMIGDPNVAYILMLMGIYGLLYECANPGMVLPGVAGAICLMLALFAFQVMPVNYAGMGLIILGIVFMIAETFAPSFGSLGVGGLIAFVIGSVILIDTDVLGYGISLKLIATFGLISAACSFFVVGMAIKARRRPIVSGKEGMIGGRGVVLDNVEGSGHIQIQGEVWNARSSVPLHRGQHVKVIKMEGLVLHVEPVTQEK